MAGAPALEETVEVCPGDGEEGTPFGFDGGGVDGWVFGSEVGAERGKVAIEKFGFTFFAGEFAEAGADEVD